MKTEPANRRKKKIVFDDKMRGRTIKKLKEGSEKTKKKNRVEEEKKKENGAVKREACLSSIRLLFIIPLTSTIVKRHSKKSNVFATRRRADRVELIPDTKQKLSRLNIYAEPRQKTKMSSTVAFKRSSLHRSSCCVSASIILSCMTMASRSSSLKTAE
jgi:hypothetical protein